MGKYPAKVALLRADTPDRLGYSYSAEALQRAADNDDRMSFDGETLWYHNLVDAEDEKDAFAKVGVRISTGEGDE